MDLVDALKRCLRAQGIGYRELAIRLGLSEAAVKRMFSLRAISLKRMEAICEVLDLGLSELAAEAERARPELSELSEAQERALVADPPLLLVLFLVLGRWRLDDVQSRFRFSEVEWIRLLARLDRLGIIELLPRNRGRPLTSRNFRWRRNGPMETFFREQLLQDYFADPFDGEQDALYLLIGSLSPDGVQALQERLRELARDFDALLLRDATLPAEQRVGVGLVLAQKPWVLRSFHQWRRAHVAEEG